jgi:hypothetical protein
MLQVPQYIFANTCTVCLAGGRVPNLNAYAFPTVLKLDPLWPFVYEWIKTA